ncbi:unnamed protein product [Oppiella nova]|uniref:non-specific serine/threonine protein kinase n=1 Tax=Oppiella nova TaxID=334625 RepID=A0A7R9LIX0_9ACAR|nr:unnamed protein product [Oppiella nova]CAG2164072.1 unnamed protein product [Oppiella nova]
MYVDFRTHSMPLFNDLGWMSFKDLLKVFVKNIICTGYGQALYGQSKGVTSFSPLMTGVGVSGYDYGYNILLVTNNDTVYGWGANGGGCLGLGHGSQVETLQLIRKLRGKRIQQFINGYDFVLAITEQNHVFSWGLNDQGQCAREATDEKVCLKPQDIWYLNDKNITYVCCGFGHSLALTTDGRVYEWGNIYASVAFNSNFRKCSPLLDKPLGSGDFTEEYIQRVYKEVQNLGAVRSEYCVQYYNSWPEGKHLYIQMEFCSQNLRNILEVKPQLCDFGLAVEHQRETQSHSKHTGTPKYMAPELYQSKYTVKVDIYSLGIISMELFDISLEDNELDKYISTSFHEKILGLVLDQGVVIYYMEVISGHLASVIPASESISKSRDNESNVSTGGVQSLRENSKQNNLKLARKN